jgi:hypothetical protein
MCEIKELRAAHERALQRHLSNLDASIAARWDDSKSAEELRRYADACEVSRGALKAAWQALNANTRRPE